VHILTLEQLRRADPLCQNPAGWVGPLNDAMLLYGVADDVDYVVEFLAQFLHETSHGNRLEENLNYSAERLAVVWPSRFAVDPTPGAPKEPNAKARALAGKPQALAENVYGGRMGNRPEGSGDGWNYRGRAAGITGRSNYARVAKLTGDPLLLSCPMRLQTKPGAAMASAAFWAADPRLNRLADDTPTDNDVADFVSITRIVNGGEIGLKERAALRLAVKAALLPTT